MKKQREEGGGLFIAALEALVKRLEERVSIEWEERIKKLEENVSIQNETLKTALNLIRDVMK